MRTNDGGPAFPDDGQQNYTGGMSLRDWFAGMALQGWLSTYGESSHPAETGYQSRVALYSYKLADAMLAERERTE